MPLPHFRHAVLVGATGMLAEASAAVVQRTDVSTLVGRNRDRLEPLLRVARRTERKAVPLLVDYHDTDVLATALAQRTAADGPFDLALCWIHSTAVDAPGLVASFVDRAPGSGRFFHVVSHTARDPEIASRLEREVVRCNGGLLYRQVVLGAMRDVESYRWLTHSEVARGIAEAISADESKVVGDLVPGA